MLTDALAEFRGPGVHHNFDDSDSGYEVDNDRAKAALGSLSGFKGRVIFLGDGTEVITDSSGNDDTEMFDGAEDKDLASQVTKSGTSEEKKEEEKEAVKVGDKDTEMKDSPANTGESKSVEDTKAETKEKK